MNVTKDGLSWSSSQGLLLEGQLEPLWLGLKSRQTGQTRFDLEHVAYYSGALLIIGAMTLYMGLSWSSLGDVGVLLLALLYALAFGFVGWQLWFRSDYRVVGGLLCTAAVFITPLVVYCLERIVGFWPQGYPGAYSDYYSHVKAGWLLMELATVIAGLLMLRFIRFPFLLTPITFSLWFMSMDLAPFLFNQPDFSFETRQMVSLVFGSIMLAGFYLIDRRTKVDYDLWGYLFGLLSFWPGLWVLWDFPGGRIIFGLINILLIILSTVLARRVFVVFGGLGMIISINYLAYSAFPNTIIFPAILCLVGLGVIFMGVKYRRYQPDIRRFVRSAVPPNCLWLLPEERV